MFEVTLPGAWSAVPSGDQGLRIYQSSQNEQLSISLHQAAGALSPAEVPEMVRELADTRRQAEREQAASDVQFSEVVFSASPPTAKFTSHDPARARNAATLVRGSSRGLFVFYLEGLDKTPSEFQQRSDAIFASIAVK
jgi:hypothetical protein